MYTQFLNFYRHIIEMLISFSIPFPFCSRLSSSFVTLCMTTIFPRQELVTIQITQFDRIMNTSTLHMCSAITLSFLLSYWSYFHPTPFSLIFNTQVIKCLRLNIMQWLMIQVTSPWSWRQNVPLKRWYPTIILHCVTTQKTSTWNIPLDPCQWYPSIHYPVSMLEMFTPCT